MMVSWSAIFLRMGLLLLALGILPELARSLLFPESSRILTGMLLVSVAPLGAVMLGVAAILFLAALYRRR
jgi:hypothetical protein